MQVWACGVSTVAGLANKIALFNVLPRLDPDFVKMCVNYESAIYRLDYLLAIGFAPVSL
jgi:hypothetical protein